MSGYMSTYESPNLVTWENFMSGYMSFSESLNLVTWENLSGYMSTSESPNLVAWDLNEWLFEYSRKSEFPSKVILKNICVLMFVCVCVCVCVCYQTSFHFFQWSMSSLTEQPHWQRNTMTLTSWFASVRQLTTRIGYSDTSLSLPTGWVHWWIVTISALLPCSFVHA